MFFIYKSSLQIIFVAIKIACRDDHHSHTPEYVTSSKAAALLPACPTHKQNPALVKKEEML